MAAEDTCKVCRFYYSLTCRRYAPQPYHTVEEHGQYSTEVNHYRYGYHWPAVQGDDWCGEYEEG